MKNKKADTNVVEDKSIITEEEYEIFYNIVKKADKNILLSSEELRHLAYVMVESNNIEEKEIAEIALTKGFYNNIAF